MAGKLKTILEAAKRALGAGEKGFVGDAGEQLSRIKTTTTPKTAKPNEGMSITPDTRRDDAWARAKAEAEGGAARGGRPADPWSGVEMSSEHRRQAAAVEARLGTTPQSGANAVPKKPDPGKPVPEAPAGMAVQSATPARPQTADEKFAAAKARVEGRPEPVTQSTGGLRLQEQSTRPRTADQAFADAKARVEGGGHFSSTPAQARPGEMGLQAKPDPWKEAQERARAADQGQVNMSRLSEAQRRDQAWDAARDHAHGTNQIDMQRLDTSALGAPTPVGSSAAPSTRRGPSSNGPGG